MKKQNKQSLIKKIILSTIIFSGIFLVIFNINFSFLQNNHGTFINIVYAADKHNKLEAKGAASDVAQQTDVSSESGGTKLNNLGEIVVYGLLKTIAILISATVHLIEFSLSEEFVNNLFNSPAIYTGWKMVRDTLNIMFIFFLLFSAFSTIFQVSKYHIKSTWVMIVVMALLVNFSWPITRVIIDFSNVTMDYILGGKDGNEVATSGLMGELSNNAKFFEIMIGTNYFVEGTNDKVNLDAKGVLSAMMIGILIGAIFLFTIGAIAILLLIRVILMAVLLVFASAGFVFAAFPSTSSVSSKWWKALLDQAILGPVVLFSLMLAVGVMGEVSDSVSQTNTMIEGQLKALPQYAVAIILIWTGILAAKSISGQTTNMALSGATRVKGLAWKGTKSAGMRVGRNVDHGMANLTNQLVQSGGKTAKFGRGLQSVRSFGVNRKEKKEKRKMEHTDAIEEVIARSKGTDGAMKRLQDKKVATEAKKLKESGTSLQTMMGEVGSAEGAKKEALLQAISNHKDFGKGDDNKYTEIMKVISKLDDGDQKKAMEGKLKENGKAHLVADAIKVKLEEEGGRTDEQIEHEVYKNVYKNMDAKTMARNTESMRIAASAPGSPLNKGFAQKLDRTGFAREFQKYANDNEIYEVAGRINNNHLG